MRLLVFETHPIQYRAPVYRELNRLLPGSVEVVYASDFSVQGYRDREFGAQFAWDVPLLDGYPSVVLGHGGPPAGWRDLGASGVFRTLRERRPDAVLLCSLRYAFDFAVYAAALALRIPVWLRIETQDNAFERTRLKSSLRSLIYRLLYAGMDRAFFIGQFNREHLLRHGWQPDRLVPAHYCTPDPLACLSQEEKAELRRAKREELDLSAERTVVTFVGKFIEKKDPMRVLQAVGRLAERSGPPLAVLMVGAGELEPALRSAAESLHDRHGVPVVFAGFVNQAALAPYYLASDILVLPSRRAGETWGLVVNEALQAGCGVVVSDAVGCHRDFGGWERVRVVPVGDAEAIAGAIGELALLPRDLDWARPRLRDYTIEAVARAIATQMQATDNRREHAREGKS